MAKEARGYVTIREAECKGCGLCVESCPPRALALREDLSAYGVHPARYIGEGCTGCGICFYCCPEPGAITVFRAVAAKDAGEAVLAAAHAAPGVTAHA